MQVVGDKATLEHVEVGKSTAVGHSADTSTENSGAQDEQSMQLAGLVI